ncbi:MAG TPA: PH domain-containing protein [Candidatus Dormibacteraeota bacterium]|nr:PH domain-containing protein [Candidatus Dormibacteraeota bacterium]
MAEVNPSKVFSFYNEVPLSDDMKKFLSDKEEVQFCVKTVRDIAVFTDKRILIADKQGITGKKVEYYSIPFKNIITYSIETAGRLDLDSEIKLTLSGGLKVELKFMKEKNMDGLLLKTYHLLNDHIIES